MQTKETNNLRILIWSLYANLLHYVPQNSFWTDNLKSKYSFFLIVKIRIVTKKTLPKIHVNVQHLMQITLHIFSFNTTFWSWPSQKSRFKLGGDYTVDWLHHFGQFGFNRQLQIFLHWDKNRELLHENIIGPLKNVYVAKISGCSF